VSRCKTLSRFAALFQTAQQRTASSRALGDDAGVPVETHSIEKRPDARIVSLSKPMPASSSSASKMGLTILVAQSKLFLNVNAGRSWAVLME
jgi:hypothetical protein